MRQILAALSLSLSLLALPAPAAAGGRSPLADVILAQELFAYASEAGDTLAMIAAAGIMARLPLREAAGAAPSAGTPPPDAARMLAAARAQAGDNAVLLGLIEDLATARPRGLAGGPTKAQRDLAVGAADVLHLRFEAGRLAELAVIGGGAADLDLVVTAADGTEVCADRRLSGRLYCGWMPEAAAEFSATVLNQGADDDTYWLLTN
jgi:hypothetical protein